MMYTVMNSLVVVPVDMYVTPCTAIPDTLFQPNCKPYMQGQRDKVLLLAKEIREWNSLTPSTVFTATIDQFKYELVKVPIQ